MIILVKIAFHMPSTAGDIITDILMGHRVQLMQYIDFARHGESTRALNDA